MEGTSLLGWGICSSSSLLPACSGLGAVAGLLSRIGQQMSCALPPSSAGSIPARNSLCLPCVHLQIAVEAVRAAVVSVVGTVWVFLSVGTSPRSAFLAAEAFAALQGGSSLSAQPSQFP